MPEIHPDDARLCVAIGAIGDERRALLEHCASLRAASAVPVVVRDGARSYARMLRADASDDPRLTSHQRRQNEAHAAQIDAWLCATTGAEGVRDA